MQALSEERTVWLTAYQDPDLFVSPTFDPVTCPIKKLEKIVVQSTKLGIKLRSDALLPVRSKTYNLLRKEDGGIFDSCKDIIGIHLIQGRFLIIILAPNEEDNNFWLNLVDLDSGTLLATSDSWPSTAFCFDTYSDILIVQHKNLL